MTTPNDSEVMSQYRTDLEVQLHPAEVADYAKRLAQIEQEMANHLERVKSIKADLAAKEAALKAERSNVAMKVRTEKEMRQVNCTIFAHWSRNLAETVRDDTGEVIASRPLTSQERQTALKIDQAAGLASTILEDARQAEATKKPEPVLSEPVRVKCNATCLAGLCTVHGSDCPDKDTIPERTAVAKGGHRMPIRDVPAEEEQESEQDEPEGEDEVTDE